MKTLLAIVMFAMLAALRADDAPAKLPVITLPVRVHLMQSDTMPAMHMTLVTSGTTGFSLNDAEIATAREKAQQRVSKAAAADKPQ